MAQTISNIKKSRGRPRVDATAIGLRLPPDKLAQLDAWIARQGSPKLTRPEAIRRLLDAGLSRQVDAKPSAPSGGVDPKGWRKPAAAGKRASAPKAKALPMSKEAQIRALREQSLDEV
jgi:hypothetical protein